MNASIAYASSDAERLSLLQYVMLKLFTVVRYELKSEIVRRYSFDKRINAVACERHMPIAAETVVKQLSHTLAVC